MDKAAAHTYFVGMPDIDLERSDYARRDPRTGKMVREPSKKSSRNLTIGCVLILAFIFWTRDAGSRESLFGVSVLFAFCAGIFASNWLKDIY